MSDFDLHAGSLIACHTRVIRHRARGVAARAFRSGCLLPQQI